MFVREADSLPKRDNIGKLVGDSLSNIWTERFLA